VKTSDSLSVGGVYTRAQLREQFAITDASINNGIFKPKGHDSVWIFVTKEKTSDRTQYADSLQGDVLTMEGQTKGRTDHLIENHTASNNELVVFYRDSKFQYPGAGFSFEGSFEYESSDGSGPKQFILRRSMSKPTTFADSSSSMQAEAENAESAGVFDPTGLEDGRKRVFSAIVRRRGQPAFRAALLHAYQGKCAVTGCALVDILEAAHVHPYMGDHTNVVSNGLLLRSDIHTLFDLKLMSVDPTSFSVVVAPSLMHTEYASHHGQAIFTPEKSQDRASPEALKWHRASREW
jgi:putative restriction endonuclease